MCQRRGRALPGHLGDADAYPTKTRCKTVREYFEKFSNKILMVENPYYKRYGSGYSLYLGLQKAFETGADEIVFAEGDLYFNGRKTENYPSGRP